ncbi:hypothetical protein KC318_g257 [Hortaea werneckii]|nr:hypothetical protein KC334_g264 [Hortaea werneckii]KAI7027468.1 hypothetical protein KC355_g324 [Hortaea werneckii]KAI7205205.1 hypothetical protein KC324_g418 [Hortaea werneckii]KAI7362769.1 hypothetical protein KC354_g7020 [Hortaea werneckii]KAI7595661.1 hypothetical protein KC316_g390 [Hortaea werneckii]
MSSSSPLPSKRVASGGDTGDKKRKKTEPDDFDMFLSGLNDETEDTNDVAAADEEVVKTTETSIEGPEQTSELDTKLLKVIKEVRDLEEEIDRKKKETEELRSNTNVITSVTKTWVKYTDMAEKIVQKHGGESSEEELKHLKNIKKKLIVLTRDLNDSHFTSLIKQAFPDEAIPGLRPFRADRKYYAQDEGNEDAPSDENEADDEGGNFSSDGHEESEAPVESDDEREYELQGEQERGYRAGDSDSGDEHRDSHLTYAGEYQKLSKPAHRRGGPRARDRDKAADRDFVVSDQARLEAESLSPESSEYSGSSDGDDSGSDVQHDESVEKWD